VIVFLAPAWHLRISVEVVKIMASCMTDAERRAFNDGLQAALLAICVGKTELSPCSDDAADVCQGCGNLAEKQKQLCAWIKALQYLPRKRSRQNLAKEFSRCAS
jgi:hypothetical protein